jgi:hypothetical protein
VNAFFQYATSSIWIFLGVLMLLGALGEIGVRVVSMVLDFVLDLVYGDQPDLTMQDFQRLRDWYWHLKADPHSRLDCRDHNLGQYLEEVCSPPDKETEA